MNYYAHGHRYIDDPYFLAGTAIPDWLSMINRKIRVRSKKAEPFLTNDDPRVVALAAGICQHHRDDTWFHQTRAFAELSMNLSLRIREVLPRDEGFRSAFLGHILVELLLDAELIAKDPSVLSRYYEAILRVDPEFVEQTVSQIAAKHPEGMARLIPRFASERFLPDYLEDAKLWFRLNQVMRRVKLPSLPESFVSFLPDARGLVKERFGELLTPTESMP